MECKRHKWRVGSILINVLVFIIIVFMVILILNQMGERFDRDCAKQNYQGIKSYWDVDIDCTQIYKIPSYTTMNGSQKSKEGSQ